MGKNLKRALALLIAVVMIIGMIPTIAFAEDAETFSQLEDGRGLGKKVPDRYVSTRNITPKTSTPKTALPASYNSNTLGYITPIRNQGSYGTCWAHGAIASCEAYMIKHGVRVGTGSAATTSLNLSESHLAWFGYTDAYDALGMLTGDKTTAASDYRDLGGFGEIPTYTLMRWEGLASESTSGLAYSSMPENGLSSSLAYQVNVAHVQDCVWIPTSDRTAVKEAIMEYGAGTFGYYADYNYEQNDGSYYYPSSKSTNHDVTVVGWDDNYSKSKFSPQPSGNGAWIIKNSWGTSHGTNGYYYISYYDVPSNNDTCYFYKVEDVDNYDNNYQYDGTTNFNNYMQLKQNGSVANVFTANGTETLEAVAFCNWTAGMSYKCDIYKNPTNSNPTSGTLVSTKSGTFEYAGYHTVELDTTVSLSAGDRFSVVFTNTGSSTIGIGLDKTGSSSGWVSWTHSSPSGASFFTNSGSWTDYSNTANLRIKAYTKNGTVVQDPCTITLKAGTTTWQTVNTTTNTSAALPSYTGTVPSGYTFAGWTAAAISGTTQTAPTLYNGSYSTGSATAITLYACFSKSEGSGGSSTGYRLMTSAPVAGDQIIIAGKNGSSYYAFKTDASTTGVAITVSNNLVTSDPTGLVWEVDSGNYGSTSGLTLSDSGYYLHINSSALKVINNDKNNGIFGFTSTGNNTYSVDGLVNSKYLGFSGTSFSASGSATGLYLFKYGTGSGSTTTYTTTITVCSHTYQETDRLDATCTEEGTIEYTCSKCGDRYYDDIPALGHDYGAFTSNSNGTHSKTCTRCSDKVTEDCSYTPTTSGATTTFTCSVCNYSYSTVLDTYTVSYNVLGSVVNTASCVEGQSVTLPATATAVDGYTFAGWTTAAIDPESTAVPTVLTGSYKPTANVTLYALYTRTEAGTGTGSGDYVKVTKTSDLTDGQYLIVYEDGEVALDSSLATIDAVEDTIDVTISNNTIPSNNTTDAAAFTFTASNGAFLGTNGKYIGHTGTSNTLNTSTSAMSNTVSIDSDGNAVIDAGSSYVLRYNNSSGQYRFRFYKSGQQSIQLYKKGAGGSSSTTYYTTSPVVTAPCAHNNMETVAAVAATCETAGNNAYYHCPDCGKYFKDAAGNTATTAAAETIAALGHAYSTTATQLDATNHKYVCSRCDAYITEAHSFTETTEGATVTHLCSACGYSYETTLNTYTVTYCVPGFESDIAPVSVIEGNSITLPTVGTVDGYTFAGWTTAAIDPESSTAPTVLTGSYQPTANVTLYALYTRTEAGEGGAAPTSGYAVGNTGSYVIAADVNGTWYALPTNPTVTSGKIDGEVITVSDNNGVKYVTTANAEGYVWTVSKSGSYYTISDGSKSIYHSNGGASGTNLTYGTSANYPWDIYTSSGNILLAGAVKSTSTRGSRGMLVRIDGDTPLFGGYSFGNVGSTDYTNVILLPVADGTSSTTYYTTSPVITAPCAHANTSVVGEVSATCTAAGYTGDTVCSDCGITVTAGEVIPALGHDIITDAGVPATCTDSGLTAGEHCSRCDYAVAQEPVPALGHDLAWDGVVGNGISHNLACARCDYTEAESCTIVNGSCTVCGYSEAAEVVVKISSAALRLGENIDLIYTASVPEDATNVYMTFTMNGKTVTVEDDGTHTFAFTAINPQCIGDNVAAKLYATVNGTEYTDEIAAYSVRQYCINKLADSSVTGTLRALISDVLAYGAAAQTYMSYNTDAMVNTGSDIANPTYSTFTSLSSLGASFDGTAANDVRWTAAGLTLTNNVAMTFRFYADSVDGLTVTVSINGRTQTFTASDFAAVDGKANTYEISFKGIKANEFADNVTASFARNGAPVGNTVSYTVNAYVCAKQAASDASLAALVKALYNYGTAAKAYNPI